MGEIKKGVLGFLFKRKPKTEPLAKQIQKGLDKHISAGLDIAAAESNQKETYKNITRFTREQAIARSALGGAVRDNGRAIIYYWRSGHATLRVKRETAVSVPLSSEINGHKDWMAIEDWWMETARKPE